MSHPVSSGRHLSRFPQVPISVHSTTSCGPTTPGSLGSLKRYCALAVCYDPPRIGICSTEGRGVAWRSGEQGNGYRPTTSLGFRACVEALKAIEYKLRRDRAMAMVEAVPSERRPALISALFEVYADPQHNVFAELMDLIAALDAHLPKLTQAEACRVLASSRHSCGHGGLEEPIDVALDAFHDSAYTPELFGQTRGHPLTCARLVPGCLDLSGDGGHQGHHFTLE